MSNIDYISNAKKILHKSLGILIVQIFLILLIIITFVFSLIKTIEMGISMLLLSLGLLMGWIMYFRLRLVIKINHKCNIIRNGEIEYAILKSVLLKPCRRGWIITFYYTVENNDIIISSKDTCHSLEEDYEILGLNFRCRDVIVPETCLIPIAKYKMDCVVLFHQCGFYDAIVKNSMSMYDLFPF